MNHYNGATVWGVLDKFTWEKTETGKDYLEVFIECQNVVLGNVRVLEGSGTMILQINVPNSLKSVMGYDWRGIYNSTWDVTRW
ncbi:MAG: hypothetical protein DWB56_06855 [Candidatus Jettenia sp.]|uniref:Uncharacterized protein n=1 Tax=Candidatus Jettenia caeni TaxID=247490 RepID=I3IMY0_9BACT|nr:hypothetical protein [Candidatus Jettenia sp. AMX1]MBC6928673.1 hypothetical protein [Candidatus Jettenia sp.]GAB63075.1 hypothetical protein KSU1_C1479 [Candidatus Jettenia caeni]KAA0250651.1 MAG: hypothetical protein EDM77_03795 [Candidatus Jettenia sp. AMX1]MCE7879985.1 hypothetical protein [Candidatus Jettenia sp. AMX1]MCQ3926767.1 hypothetical protein [Candidatus Jettenia sp.]